jgi:hypothetical protein
MGWMLLVWVAIGTAAMAVVGVARSLRSRRMRRIVNEPEPAELITGARSRTKSARARADQRSDSEARVP